QHPSPNLRPLRIAGRIVAPGTGRTSRSRILCTRPLRVRRRGNPLRECDAGAYSRTHLMAEPVIVGAVRAPIGRAGKGSLKDVRADDLAAVPLKALVERNPEVDFAETDDIMMGCGFQAGEQGYNIGRNAQLLSGIDHHVPATTVNRFCASSLQTLRMGFHAITAGEGDQYIAAGVEAVSRFGQGGEFQFHPKLDG